MLWGGQVLMLFFIFCLGKATQLNEDSYIDLGFHVVGTGQTKVNGTTKIRVIFTAPRNTTTYWDVNAVPILDTDRYSSVRTEKRGSFFISTITSTADITVAVLNAYAFRTYTVSMKIIFARPEQTRNQLFLQNVRFTKPEHTGTSVKVNYKYNTYNSEPKARLDAITYFVQGNPSTANKKSLLGSKQSDLFENQVSETGNQATSTLVPRDLSLINSGSTLVTYGIFLSYTTSRAFMRFEIEDDVDFTRQQRPLANADIVITGFYTTPSPLVGTRQGSIVCGAIGNPAPSLEILKLLDNGEYKSVNYPEHLFRTNFRTVKTLVINFPSDQDSGNYTCIARSPSKEARKWQFTKFEPPPRFLEDATRIINMENGTTQIKLLAIGYYEFNVKCFANDINGTELTDEIQKPNYYTVEGLTKYQRTKVTITFDPSQERPNQITCKAFYSWTGESFYTFQV